MYHRHNYVLKMQLMNNIRKLSILLDFSYEMSGQIDTKTINISSFLKANAMQIYQKF
jgi:hypothetical protein